jgi:hypothetical protein
MPASSSRKVMAGTRLQYIIVLNAHYNVWSAAQESDIIIHNAKLVNRPTG